MFSLGFVYSASDPVEIAFENFVSYTGGNNSLGGWGENKSGEDNPYGDGYDGSFSMVVGTDECNDNGRLASLKFLLDKNYSLYSVEVRHLSNGASKDWYNQSFDIFINGKFATNYSTVSKGGDPVWYLRSFINYLSANENISINDTFFVEFNATGGISNNCVDWGQVGVSLINFTGVHKCMDNLDVSLLKKDKGLPTDSGSFYLNVTYDRYCSEATDHFKIFLKNNENYYYAEEEAFGYGSCNGTQGSPCRQEREIYVPFSICTEGEHEIKVVAASGGKQAGIFMYGPWQGKTPDELNATHYEINASLIINITHPDVSYVNNAEPGLTNDESSPWVVESIELMNVQGRGLGFPINLDYTAGISVKQEASWVGLGWNLNNIAIKRRLNFYPDDYPNGWLLGQSDYGQDYYISPWGRLASQNSTKEFFTETWSNLDISYEDPNGGINYWEFMDEDGTKYIFGEPVYTLVDSRYNVTHFVQEK